MHSSLSTHITHYTHFPSFEWIKGLNGYGWMRAEYKWSKLTLMENENVSVS